MQEGTNVQNEFSFVVTEITKQGSSIPSGSGSFQFFSKPTTNNQYVVFYGNNQSEKDFCEGLYLAPVNGSEKPICISDNLTALPEIGKPTTIINSADITQDAFAPYLNNAIFSIAESNEACSTPRAIIANHCVIFFAADWSTGKQGIFSYSIKNKTIQALITTTKGTLKNGMLGFPASDGNTVIFLAAKSKDDIKHAGIWRIPLAGGSLTLAISSDGVNHLQSFSNPQLDQGSIAFVASLNAANGNTIGGIFRTVKLETPDDSVDIIQKVIQTGDPINDQYSVKGSSPFWPEISYQDGVISAKADIHEGAAVISIDYDNQITLISTNYVNQAVPGGGWYSGNEFATPSVTSNGTLLYAAMVEEVGKSFGSTFELFGWNINNKQQLIRLLDGQTDKIGEDTIFNIYMNIDCYCDGVLAGHVLLSSEKEGVYIFQLSELG